MKSTMRWLLPLVVILSTTVLTYGVQSSTLCNDPESEYDNTFSIPSLEPTRGGGSHCCQCQRGPRGLPGDSGPQGAQGQAAFTEGQTYYLQVASADVSNYRQLLTSQDASPENASCKSVNNNSPVPPNSVVLIDQFITDPGITALGFIPAGAWVFKTYASIDNPLDRISQISIYVYIRHADNTETFLFNCDTPQITNQTPVVQLYISQCSYNAAVTTDLTDRIVVKYYAKTTSTTNRTVCLYYAGAENYSNLITPIPVPAPAPVSPSFLFVAKTDNQPSSTPTMGFNPILWNIAAQQGESVSSWQPNIPHPNTTGYICPATGRYLISATANILYDDTGTNEIAVNLAVNNIEITGTQMHVVMNDGTAGEIKNIYTQAIVSLTAGQVVSFNWAQSELGVGVGLNTINIGGALGGAVTPNTSATLSIMSIN